MWRNPLYVGSRSFGHPEVAAYQAFTYILLLGDLTRFWYCLIVWLNMLLESSRIAPYTCRTSVGRLQPISMITKTRHALMTPRHSPSDFNYYGVFVCSKPLCITNPDCVAFRYWACLNLFTVNLKAHQISVGQGVRAVQMTCDIELNQKVSQLLEKLFCLRNPSSPSFLL